MVIKVRTIKFNVNQQRIKNVNSVGFIYKGTDNYLRLEFNFNSDWDGCKKAISFGSKELAMLLEDGNTCVVPKEAFDETKLTFYLVGKKKDYRIQTQEFVIRLSN